MYCQKRMFITPKRCFGAENSKKLTRINRIKALLYASERFDDVYKDQFLAIFCSETTFRCDKR
jgi:hypothetical protein